MSKYKNAVCRGSWSLGTACGTCERCIEFKPAAIEKPMSKPFFTAIKLRAWMHGNDWTVESLTDHLNECIEKANV